MAKGRYATWLEPDGLTLLRAWKRNGLTDEQIARNCGINVATLYRWKNEHSKICEALKHGKEIADIEVENALYRKTQGYTVEVRKTFKVKRSEYDEDTGKKIAEYEELVTGVDEVHMPADTNAQVFWLTNRKGEAWKKNPEGEAIGDEVQFIDDV